MNRGESSASDRPSLARFDTYRRRCPPNTRDFRENREVFETRIPPNEFNCHDGSYDDRKRRREVGNYRTYDDGDSRFRHDCSYRPPHDSTYRSNHHNGSRRDGNDGKWRNDERAGDLSPVVRRSLSPRWRGARRPPSSSGGERDRRSVSPRKRNTFFRTYENDGDGFPAHSHGPPQPPQPPTVEKRQSHFSPCVMRFERSKIVMMYPIPADSSSFENEIEIRARDCVIDLKQSPPQSFKYVDIPITHWENIYKIIGGRTWQNSAEIAAQTQTISDSATTASSSSTQSIRVCLANFASRGAASAFVYEIGTLEVNLLGSGVTENLVSSSSSCLSRNNNNHLTQQQKVLKLSLHLLEAAPIDLYPLVRVISHPAFLDFEFQPSPFVDSNLLRKREFNTVFRGNPWNMAPLPAVFIHTRRAEDRSAHPLCHIPLRWKCILCEGSNLASETARGCATCGSVRTVLSSLMIDEEQSPGPLKPFLRRTCPKIRTFIAVQNLPFILQHDDLFLLEDEAPERDSYSFFTKQGLFYTLDMPSNTLILTHVLAVEAPLSLNTAKHPPLDALFPQGTMMGTTTIERSGGNNGGVIDKSEEHQRQANASLVASVLAQAQHAASMAAKSAAAAGGLAAVGSSTAAAAASSSSKVSPSKLFDGNTGEGTSTDSPSLISASGTGTQSKPTTVRLNLPRSNMFVPPSGATLHNCGASAKKLNWQSSDDTQTAKDNLIMKQKPRPLLKGAPPPIQAVAEIRNPESRLCRADEDMKSAEQKEIEEHNLICFVCLRQFATPELLQQHEEVSELHQHNLKMADEHEKYVRSCEDNDLLLLAAAAASIRPVLSKETSGESQHSNHQQNLSPSKFAEETVQ